MTVRHARRRRVGAAALGAAALTAAVLAAGPYEARPADYRADPIRKIQHVVMIMQETRSFDSYFGTFPGADGIPMDRPGNPKVCVPDPSAGICWRPYHDPRVRTGGGPHGAQNSKRDINGGRMDGFIEEARHAPHRCKHRNDPVCSPASALDVMGCHDDREIPNYWKYARE